MNKRGEMVPVEFDIMGTTQTFLMTKEDADKELERRKRCAAKNERLEDACLRARKLYRDQPTAEHRAALIAAIDKRTTACNSHERADVMMQALGWNFSPVALRWGWSWQLPAEIFWPVFMDTWPVCDAAEAWNGIILTEMRKHQPATEYMTAEIREATDALPDLIEVWRGADRSTVRRFSWTTDPVKAEYFAVHRRGVPFPDPVIAHAFIPKAHVFYADNGRSEAEVLLDPRRLRKLTVGSVAHIEPVVRWL